MKAKKKWGQHFLVHERYITKMLKAAALQAHDGVLEIGPGKGVLTRALLNKGASVTAVEIDEELYRYLKEKWGNNTLFHITQSDVMELSQEKLLSLYPTPYKVIANLPYNIVSPLIFKLMEVRHHLISLTLMMQKEVAERLCATPKDGKAYGVLSVAGAIAFDANIEFYVPPKAFSPPPKVESAVVHLVPQQSGWSSSKEQNFLKWIQLLFQQRRKTLVNNIQSNCPQWYLDKGDDLRKRLDKRRAESLVINEWRELYENYCDYIGILK